jgi:hypothetical protein
VASEKQDSGAKISQIIIMVQMTANQVQNQVMQYTSSAKVLPSFAEESPSFAEELPSFAEYFFLRRLGHRVFTEIPKPQNPNTPNSQNDSIVSVYIPNIVSALQISAKSFSTVFIASSAAFLNSYSASSTLNVSLFLYLAAIEAIADMQYHIREASKSPSTNNDDI